MSKTLALLAALVAFGVPVASHAANQRPNVVVILSDDYGYGSAGCYGADGRLVRTPNIDRLAREGRRFTDANTTSSVCSPTRYSVMTGRYCWRTALQSGVQSTFSPLHIDLGRLTMASLLKGHGYRTAAIGKWHLGYGTSDGTLKWRTDYTAELTPGPLDIGFDYHFAVPSNHGDLTGIYVENRFVYGLRSGKIPPSMRVPGPVPDDDNFKPTYTRDDTEAKRADPMTIDAPRRVNERVMPLLTDKALHFIETCKPGQPFFLYFTPVAVHNPVTPEKDLAGQSKAGPFGDWIHELDRSVGRILDLLDKQDLAKDTLVIFSSDNGGVCEPQRADTPQTQALNAGLAVNGPLRGGKHHVWEGGFKVPFLVRWPGRAPAGTVCDEMVSLADLLATAAALVDEPLPPAARAAEDSYNILPAILGKPLARPIRPDMIVHSSDGVFAIRKGPWKWVEGIPADDIRAAARRAHADEFRPQLFNTREDPAETKDVAAEHPDVVRELEALLDLYRDGGYSRQQPPATARKAAAAELSPLSGKIVLQDPLAKVPGAPWALVRGRWAADSGAVWGSQKPGEQQPAALRGPLGITDGAIQYEISLPAATRHSVRIQCQERTHVFRLDVSPRKLAVLYQPVDAKGAGSAEVLASQPAKLVPGRWYPLRITFAGKDLTVQVGGAKATASHPFLAETKTAFALMVSGEKVGFRNVAVARP